jgi:hypothetical protein
MPGLGRGIGRIIVIPVLIFAGYETAVASIALCYIYYHTPFSHIHSLLFSISTRQEFGAIPQAFLDIKR